MTPLKSISRDAIPGALDRVERYRLLNEPELAESICEDVLAIDPDNQSALVMLLLSLTDQFRGDRKDAATRAREVLEQLKGDYERLYYAGIIRERRSLARLSRGGPGSDRAASVLIHEAMAYYERAEAIRPAGNDDAILRWNTCARLRMRHHLEHEEEEFHPALDDF
jgi:tetratricopeptide (TPR) repeat protein